MKNNQFGRSMVEMLGTLAIMGILSVGGVAMYSSAVKKHRANEILNEFYKRASFVAMRLTAGQSADQVSLAEFQQYDNLGYAQFAQGVTKVGENQFKLSLSAVPDTSICDQIKASVGPNTSFISVTDNCSAVTFNNDLSKNSSSDQENSLTETPSADCTGKEDGTLCDTPFDTLYWGHCYNEICLSWQPSCKWTEWFDVDTPPEGSFNDSNGDFETIENIRAAGGEVCDHPQEIECEALKYLGLTVKQVGQNAVCDPESGLICINSEQPGLFKHCYDYHVRFLCCEYKDGRVRRSPIS